MNQQAVESFVAGLENVQREDNFGYAFFFVGEDHRLPFVSISDSDNEYDRVSNLDREGVFRLNIGVSKTSFDSLFPDSGAGEIDYTVLDVFLPHPEYARQHFICILNPDAKAEATRQYILEAHSLAAARLRRKSGE
jgi:hypothetical protein